ncbi:MAG: radical SAM protein, partial [Acidimicrobiales bacterium]
GDFVANGVVSHNCFARGSHSWLELDTGRGFDTEIVVKVNAADRLRVELAHPRWAGDSIAMGTNTDPYQRAEARYHLTRRITEVLVERANPFSVLTKSTLILRDLDLLARAAAAGLVRVNLSIGTLDEQVWRATEPGTPHPARRLEAVARLNQAGVPCGVLVAPVLPGLSDHPQQLRAVVEGAVAAGAVSVTPIALHLRPGVREHFLSWLAGYRPDLVGTYTQRYSRAYLPAADQKGLAAAVAGWQRGCPAPEATDGPTRQERPGRASSSQHAE